MWRNTAPGVWAAGVNTSVTRGVFPAANTFMPFEWSSDRMRQESGGAPGIGGVGPKHLRSITPECEADVCYRERGRTQQGKPGSDATSDVFCS